jgi:hypothetical protein
MWTLAQYTLTEPLLVGPLYVFYRAYRNADHAPVVVKLFTSEQPSQREIARLRHEYLIARDIWRASATGSRSSSRTSAGAASTSSSARESSI